MTTGNLDDIYGKLVESMSLGKQKIRDDAGKHWARQNAAIREGTENEDDLKKVRVAYDKIKRLSREAKDIIEHSAETNNTSSSSYAIDPHILRAYAQIHRNSSHTDFDFLETEWPRNHEDDRFPPERVQFIELLYHGILNEPHLICTEVGRKEISNHVAFLANYLEREAAQNPQVKQSEVLELAKEIEEVARFATRASEWQFDPGEVSEYIQEHFAALVHAASAPGLAERYALNRMRRAINFGNIYMAEIALRQKLGNDVKEVSKLLRKFRRDTDAFSTARNAHYFAYKLFFLGGDATDDQISKYKLGIGQKQNIEAIFEINLLNTCLDLLGKDHVVRYLTASRTTYAFLEGFDRKVLRCPLVHPRHYFFHERPKDFADNRDKFIDFASYFTAASRRIEALDRVVSQDELKTFDEAYRQKLIDLRDASSFLVTTPNTKKSKEFAYVSSALESFLEDKLEDKNIGLTIEDREKINAALSSINSLASNFNIVAKSTRTALNKAIENAEADMAKTLREMTKQAADAGLYQDDEVLVRAVKDGQGNRVARYTCIPLTGGYRYMFSIFNTAVLEQLEKEFGTGATVLKTLDFLGLVKTECKRLDDRNVDEQIRIKSKALGYFVEAFHTASLRDWMLAFVLVQKALTELEGLSTLELKARLLKQELLFFRHLMRRAIAQESDSFKARMAHLQKAGEDLAASAEIVVETGKNTEHYNYGTSVNPVSVKMAFAAVGLIVEWLVLSKDMGDLRRNKDAEERLELLPDPGSDSDLAWANEHVLQKSIVLRCAHENTVRGLNRTVLQILDKIATQDEVVSQSRIHDSLFWNHMYRRGYSIQRFMAMCVDAGRLEGAIATTAPAEQQEQFEVRNSKFVDAVNELERESLRQDDFKKYDNSPFIKAFLAWEKLQEFCKEGEAGVDGGNSPVESYSKLQSLSQFLDLFSQIDEYCGVLEKRGLPRAVTKDVKKRCATQILPQLEEVCRMLSTKFVSRELWR